jgi:phage replication O-like protein O
MSKDGKTEKTKPKFPGFRKPTYTIVPDELFDELLADLTGSELKVLLYIIRRTFGWKKDTDNISLKQMIEGITKADGSVLDSGTGLSKPTVTKAVKSLVAKNVILARRRRSHEKGDESTTYALNVIGDPVLKNLTGGGKRIEQGGVKKDNPQHTVIQDTDNNSSVVVNTLKEFKIEDQKARELASRFPSEHIQEKLEFLKWKLETRKRGRPIQDPAAWLVRAIEKDYKPPPAFHSRQEIARQQAEQRKRSQELRAEEERERARHLDELRQKYGTSQRELDLWPQVLGEISLQTTKATFNTWFTGTSLLALEADRAVIGVPNSQAKEWLQNRLYKIIQRSLDAFLDTTVELDFVVLEKAP